MKNVRTAMGERESASTVTHTHTQSQPDINTVFRNKQVLVLGPPDPQAQSPRGPVADP